MSAFTHLHLHSQYSLLDGAIRLSALPHALRERGYSAAALTDHGNLFGAVEFYKTMKKAGLKPIIGIEAYVADETRTTRNYPRPGPNASHLVLLCQNEEGYRNLTRLASRAFIEGKYYGVPRMDRELLEQYNGGLIALSACLGGVINRPLLQGNEAKARELAQWYGQVFDGRFYMELQNHGLEAQQRTNPVLQSIAADLGLPLVGTNDCHYLDPGEAYPHHILQLMGWQKKVTDPDVEPFSDKQLHLKNPDEMATALAPFPPEAITNTARIADQCDLSLSSGKIFLPKFEVPAPFTEEEFFRQLVEDGLARRLEKLAPLYGIAEDKLDDFYRPYQERLNFELEVILGMSYSGYFLIVADFINWAKDHGVRVGPGRGSGAGSLVAYSLRITDLDPLLHGLLFERFLNPERVSLPDFDIDFDVAGRDRVIDYVRQKYGDEKVCQISTFGSLGAKAALRGVARVLDFPYSQADKIAKLIPNVLGITLEQAIAMEPELARLEKAGDENERSLIANGKALEGLNSNLSTHAAGVIIMDTDIQDVMPVCTSAKGDGGIQSMYSMKWAEDQGAVKFDFLGLLNLTIIEAALGLINAPPATGEGTHSPTGHPPLDIDALPLDDPKTFALLQRGDTTGVFQLESGGMRRLLVEMKPTEFEDIVAILALYRPGPLESGMAAQFVNRKNGKEPVESLHPLLDPVLGQTYGVMVYQEQVIQAARVLAGFSLGQADLLRRAIGKKIATEMAEQREKFLAGCEANGIDKSRAEEIFTKIEYFSGYGFNKSHSAAYGLIAYQTAYMKAHYPVEFMAALLSSDMDKTDKVVNFIAECRDMGIEVLPPDINHSGHGFTVHGRAIRFGMNAVKNVGANAVEVILAARAAQPEGRFQDLAAFVTSVDLHRVNKRVLEALVQCGGFDSIEPDRGRMLAGLERIVALGLSHRNDQVEGQETLFGLLSAEETEKIAVRVDLPEAPPLPRKKLLKLEKEALGFYISGHPLHRYGSELGGLASSTNDLREGDYADDSEATLAGVVAHLTVRMSRNGEKFAIVKLEDLRGSIEVVVYARLYAQVSELLKEDEPLLIQGRVRAGEEEVSVVATKISSLAQHREMEAVGFTIALAGDPPGEALRAVKGELSKRPGNCPVRFRLTAANGYQVWVDTGLKITPSDDMLEELERALPRAELNFSYPKRNGNSQGASSPAMRPAGFPGPGASQVAPAHP